MKKLISILASTIIAVSAIMTTSGMSKKSSDADAVSAATEKTTYTIQDVRNLQDFLLGRIPMRSLLTPHSWSIRRP